MKFDKTATYEPLSQSSNEWGSEKDAPTKTATKSSSLYRSTTLSIIFCASILTNFVLVVVGIRFYCLKGPYNPIFPQQLFSPAQDVISYKVEKFDVSKNIYRGGPTPETNAAWKALYAGGTSTFPAESAHKLANQTIAANPDGSGGYLVVLSAIHDLHCVDKIRLALWHYHNDQWNATYNPYTLPTEEDFDLDGQFGIFHLDHCLDFLRQSIQCAGDVSPIVYQWQERVQEIRAFAAVAHTCRNWDAIHQWTLDNHSPTRFDVSVRREQRGQCQDEEDGSCLEV